MFEHQQMCEEADEKSYKNHMLILNPYVANHKKAMESLDISFESVQEHLKDLGIGFDRLDTDKKIINMFQEDLTYGVHNAESVKNG